MDSSDTEPEEPPIDGSTTDDMDDSTEGGADQPDGTMSPPEEDANSPDTIPPENSMPDESITPGETQEPPVTPPVLPVPEGGAE